MPCALLQVSCSVLLHYIHDNTMIGSVLYRCQSSIHTTAMVSQRTPTERLPRSSLIIVEVLYTLTTRNQRFCWTAVRHLSLARPFWIHLSSCQIPCCHLLVDQAYLSIYAILTSGSLRAFENLLSRRTYKVSAIRAGVSLDLL